VGATAALVIQGSASIYSKKVEYLHKMCHQALDFIADTQRKEAAAGEDGMEYDAERSLDDEIDAFLRFGDNIDGKSPRPRPLSVCASLSPLLPLLAGCARSRGCAASRVHEQCHGAPHPPRCRCSCAAVRLLAPGCVLVVLKGWATWLGGRVGAMQRHATSTWT
jgi:hypothetical protein